jgi:hypothetical protein
MGKIEDIFAGNIDMFQALINKNIEKLKQFGTIGEHATTIDGVKTITYTFTAKDGSVYVFSDSSFADNITYQRIQKLNKHIADAVAKEDYLLAAEFKKEKDILLTETN